MTWLKKFSGAVVGVAAMALTLAACGEEPVLMPSPADEVNSLLTLRELPYETTPHVDDAARVSQEIAWRVIQSSDDDNRIVSPSSLSMSMAQAAEGAQTVTLDSFDDVLGLSGDERASAFGALKQALSPYDSLPEEVSVDEPPASPVVHQASRVMAIEAMVEQGFVDRIGEFYDAGAAQSPRVEAQGRLDEWVKLHTAGLIEKSAVEVKPNTVAVLQDALLFAAAWRTPFDSERPVPFTGPDGAGEVDGVSGVVTARVAEGDGWTVVRLPYDDNLAADVVLPAGDPDLLTAADLEDVAAALAGAPEQQVKVTMPSFDLATKTDLLKALPEIDLSDLGGIVPGSYGDQWVQQVVLQVSAQGTVGAAVTELAAAESLAAADAEFNVDRAYVFRVLDTRTQWPLFLGIIADPAA